MDLLFVVARVTHVALGVFWAGTLVFVAAFLNPSVRDAGPDGAKVMAGIMRRRFLDIMPVVALLTLVTGFYLYWRASGGFSPGWMGSGTGITFGVGAVAALVAFGLGVGILRPAILRAAALTVSAANAAPEAKERALSEAGALRARGAATGRIVAWLLAVATFAMALARYV